MGDRILVRDIPLSWDCPACGAKAALEPYMHSLIQARCAADCTHIHEEQR